MNREQRPTRSAALLPDELLPKELAHRDALLLVQLAEHRDE